MVVAFGNEVGVVNTINFCLSLSDGKVGDAAQLLDIMPQ